MLVFLFFSALLLIFYFQIPQEGEIVSLDKSFLVLSRLAILATIGGGVVLVLLIYILRSVAELEKKSSEAERAKSEFVSMASHQLRTPLANVNWYTEMLLAGDAGKINKEQRQYLEEVYNSNQRMVELVNALLNVDLGSFSIDPEPLDIIEVAESALGEMLPQTENKKIKVEKNFEKNLPAVNADPRLIRIVLQNLLSNSIKYSPESGKVTLAVKKIDSDILISVSDRGFGIPEAQKEKIFTRLFRADNIIQKSEGTGLGLYIAKAVMEQTGGKIWFESKENFGTDFHFTIPLEGMKKKKGARILNRQR